MDVLPLEAGKGKWTKHFRQRGPMGEAKDTSAMMSAKYKAGIENKRILGKIQWSKSKKAGKVVWEDAAHAW